MTNHHERKISKLVLVPKLNEVPQFRGSPFFANSEKVPFMKSTHPTRGFLLTLTVLLSAVTTFLLAGGMAFAEPSDTTPENTSETVVEEAAQETATAPEVDTDAGETEVDETEVDESSADETNADDAESDDAETDDAEVTDVETNGEETDDSENDDAEEADAAEETKPSYRMVTLDELDSILKLPENADAAALLAFIESTDTLRPAGLLEQNTDAQTQLRQLDLFLTKVLDARIAAAEKVLTLQDVNAETRQNAIDYKIASLLSLAKVDAKNEPRMRAYLDELRKDAEPAFAWNLDSVQLHYDFGKLQKAPSVEDYRATMARLFEHIRKGCEQKCLDTDFLEAVLPFVMISEKLLPTKDAVETLNGLATLLEKEEDETCKLVVDYFRMTAKRLSLVGQPLAKTFQTFDGKEAKIDAKPGKNTVLVFWAVEDQNSLEEIPFLLQMYQGYHAKGFDVISIVCDEDSKELRELLKQVDFDWPTVLDGSNTDEKKQPALWSNEFSITGLPTKLLIGPDGKVASSNIELVDLLDVLERAYGKIEEAAPRANAEKDPQLEAAEAEINAAIDAAVEQPVESPVKPAVEPAKEPSRNPERNGPSEESPAEPAAETTAEPAAESPAEPAVETPVNTDAPVVEPQGENALNTNEKNTEATPGKTAEAAPKKNTGKAKTHKTKAPEINEPTVQPGEVLIVQSWGEEPVEDESDDADDDSDDEDDGDDELKDDDDDDTDDANEDDADDDDSDDVDDDENDADDDSDDDLDDVDDGLEDTAPAPAENNEQAPPENTDMAETPRTEDEERLIGEDEDNMEDEEFFMEEVDEDFDDGQPKG